jgi:hypothetical protein
MVTVWESTSSAGKAKFSQGKNKIVYLFVFDFDFNLHSTPRAV